MCVVLLAGLTLLRCGGISSGHAAASRAVTAQGRCRHCRHGRSRSLQVSAQVAAMSGLRGPRLWSAPVCGLRAMAGPLAAIRRRPDAVGARISESLVVSSERQLQVGGRRRTGVPNWLEAPEPAMFSKRCEAHRKHDTLNCLGSWLSLELSEGRRGLESARRGMHRDEAAAPRCRETRQGPVRSGRPAARGRSAWQSAVASSPVTSVPEWDTNANATQRAIRRILRFVPGRSETTLGSCRPPPQLARYRAGVHHRAPRAATECYTEPTQWYAVHRHCLAEFHTPRRSKRGMPSSLSPLSMSDATEGPG